MYEAHWQLKSKPFESFAGAAFHYPVAAHHAARLKIQYAIESRRAAALLVGAPGIGKSLLVQGLTKQLNEAQIQVLRIDYPLLSAEELLSCLARDYSDTKETANSKVLHLQELEKRLASLRSSHSHSVVVIEEAHLLRDPAVAETLRILPHLGHGESPAVTVLLVGQSSLAPWLNAFPAWEEHFGAKCHLPALNCEETMGYVAHRLRAAGAAKNPFTNKSLESLHHLSGGSPRRINRLADLALLVAFAEDVKQVDVPQVEAVAEELALRVD
jgi:type II secretory pathway predicted ATPase ExeA